MALAGTCKQFYGFQTSQALKIIKLIAYCVFQANPDSISRQRLINTIMLPLLKLILKQEQLVSFPRMSGLEWLLRI